MFLRVAAYRSPMPADRLRSDTYGERLDLPDVPRSLKGRRPISARALHRPRRLHFLSGTEPLGRARRRLRHCFQSAAAGYDFVSLLRHCSGETVARSSGDARVQRGGNQQLLQFLIQITVLDYLINTGSEARSLFDRNAFCQVSRLVHIRPAQHGCVIREQLQRDDVHDGR